MLVDVTARGVIELRPVGTFSVETYSDTRLKEFEVANRLTSAEKALLAKALRRN
ncbi:MAG: hypothetical protein HS110_02275 [Zoogloeaceae bacterium]|nr:hypothetical protein [Zoogloeaceae bacterium]MCK6385833.1 hypothetical protein [Rhodocyclaceae bacterium]